MNSGQIVEGMKNIAQHKERLGERNKRAFVGSDPWLVGDEMMEFESHHKRLVILFFFFRVGMLTVHVSVQFINDTYDLYTWIEQCKRLPFFFLSASCRVLMF
jgi:hypothetical protein